MPRKATHKVSGGVLVNPTDIQVTSRTGDSSDIYRPTDSRDLTILLDKAVTTDDWYEIFKKALSMSLEGGMTGIKAMEFLARYRWGLPQMMTVANDSRQAPITVIEVVMPPVAAKVDGVQSELAPVTEIEKVIETATVDSDVPF